MKQNLTSTTRIPLSLLIQEPFSQVGLFRLHTNYQKEHELVCSHLKNTVNGTVACDGFCRDEIS